MRGITGEPAAAPAELPDGPHPRWGPESVVAAQLEAFRWAGGGRGRAPTVRASHTIFCVWV